jgi:hypothetical protein
MRFYSDNTATAAPEILAAIAEANQGHTVAYGDDPWTQRLDEVLGKFFGTPVRAFAVATGTAANSLSLATLSPPWGAIYATNAKRSFATPGSNSTTGVRKRAAKPGSSCRGTSASRTSLRWPAPWPRVPADPSSQAGARPESPAAARRSCQ